MRTHIDFGIYFNSDFCQIARIENGVPVIVKTNTMKDSLIQPKTHSLVIDFGVSEFKVALIKKGCIIDSDGDDWLGGANLDMAIVDQIIIPYFNENFAIKSILEDTTKREILRETVKSFAKEAKTQLAYNDSHYIISNVGDLPFEDETGEALELDIEINQQDLAWVSRPIYQKVLLYSHQRFQFPRK